MHWDAYVAARSAQTTPFGDRDELHRFIVGVHLSGEPLTAQDLRELLDRVAGDDAERDALATFIEQSLALLTFYDQRPGDDDDYDSDQMEGWLEL